MSTSQRISRTEKHFLDTSIARPLFMASDAYRRYLRKELADGSCYTSIYIQMEVRRSFVRAVVAFYSTLQLESILCIQDALALWANQFKTSQLKAILHLLSQ